MGETCDPCDTCEACDSGSSCGGWEVMAGVLGMGRVDGVG